MGRTKQEWIAMTMGSRSTLYAVMKALGLPLSPEQEKFQDYLEKKYPAIAKKEEEPNVESR